MADFFYSWANLEKNIPDASKHGYLHGTTARLNILKERSPEFIWLVRLDKGRLWLLGKLAVTDKRPKTFPKNHESQYIFYDPSKSHFYSDVESVSVATEDLLRSACAPMRINNMEGVGAAQLIEPIIKVKLDSLVSPFHTISFAEFRQQLEDRVLPRPPFRFETQSGERKARSAAKLPKV